MFGYITVNASSLSKEDMERFRSCYCTLCHTLGSQYGAGARTLLSYDMTFLAMLLDSLYEDAQTACRHVCPVRPWKRTGAEASSAYEYAADMNIAYGYFKALDDAADDHSARAKLLAASLKGRYAAVRAKYPEKCARIEDCIRRLSEMEKNDETQLDPPANAMGELFGEVYGWRYDFWHDTLYALGAAIGRFIYICDAFEDRPKDVEKGRYNPLNAYADRPDYAVFVRRVLTMMISEGAQAFEMLPAVRDADILRNVLYSGVWSHCGTGSDPESAAKKHSSLCRKEKPE